MPPLKKSLPIGMETFTDILTQNMYYVDKTNFISDLLENKSTINLFTRPRRFGKTLNMDMLRTFFEPDHDHTIFQNLNISKNNSLCTSHMGKYPVISLSLKGVINTTFSGARYMLSTCLAEEFRRHDYLSNSPHISVIEKIKFEQYCKMDIEPIEPDDSLRFLSILLNKHHTQKVIVLIDEYDVPLDKAHQYGYYDEMISLIRNTLSQVLKTNNSLFFAVLIGCLRISKESVFTGFNNMKVFSVADVMFAQYFGFTDKEVRDMLDYYNISDKYEETGLWYNGYSFGLTKVYNPWDVLNHCYELITNPYASPKSYWINTSGNDIIRHLISIAKATTKDEIERLISGENITKKLNIELTYRDLYDSIENIWSVLYMTGYLTHVSLPLNDVFELVIPNESIRKIFRSQIYEWFNEYVSRDSSKLDNFCMMFRNGDAEGAQNAFTDYLKRVISIRDNNVPIAKKENFYHGILLGLFSHMEEWIVRSNVESGDGYSDIIIEIPEDEIGIIIEVKFGEDSDMESGCQKALEQIENKNYAEILEDDGMTTILKYGIACYKKRCKIVRA